MEVAIESGGGRTNWRAGGMEASILFSDRAEEFEGSIRFTYFALEFGKFFGTL